MSDFQNIFITGADGFIGSHLLRQLAAENVKPDTLSRHPEATIVCNLENDVPQISRKYDVVVHLAGTNDDARADSLNNHGTRRLLEALNCFPPTQFIYISSVEVYGLNPGEDVAESCFLRPDTPAARSKIRAEKTVEKWCADHGVVCTILRPASVIGDGMHGLYARMANSVSRGYYMHIRGNTAVRSLVMVDDVANAIRLTFGVPGIFNVTDGHAHSIIDIADAMAANFDTDKRILFIPGGLVKWGLLLFPLSSLKSRHTILTRSATYSNNKLCENVPFSPFHTVDVMALRSNDYPYRMKSVKTP